MTIGEFYKKYIAALENIYDKGEAAAITNIIFEHFTGMGRRGIIMNGNTDTDHAKAAALEIALQKLLLHVPAQYITGETRFYGIKFKVNEDVLIPRPETEELVQEADDFLKKNSGKKILDIGTGSGCIAVSLKKNIPDADVTATDFSKNALDIAGQNAVCNETPVNFIHADFLDEVQWSLFKTYDLIISNPPYIPENEKNMLDKNVVMHEPHSALFVPQHDPLIFYRKIFSFAKEHLNDGGRIMLEVHEDLAKETAAIFRGENYAAAVKKDMSGKERMVIVSHRPKR